MCEMSPVWAVYTDAATNADQTCCGVDDDNSDSDEMTDCLFAFLSLCTKTLSFFKTTKTFEN